MSTDPTSLDVQRLADHAAIVRLTHDYCWALDTNEFERLRDVFTPDATAELGGARNGIDAIIERVAAALGPLDDSQHIVATHQIDIAGDAATGRCYLHAQHIKRGTEAGELYVVAGRYEDRFVRTADGWRIAERALIVMWTDGNPRVTRPRPD